MSTLTVDIAVEDAYHNVRDDSNEANWAVFAYADDVGSGDANTVVVKASGDDGLEGLKGALVERERAYGFLRVISGDEMSARPKFVFIAWVPDGTPIMKKAKVSTDKAFVKEVVRDFAVELLANDLDDLEEEVIMKEVRRAGGASYGSSST
eukprot:TRINITY_DN138_c0_g2_i1.p2 TRINITY_DN138_c0_g2~~TRINITY_DN138_c0_g2_i1.p2  ORF type:complete len:151 (-),score=41.68 TRINITY_DN138_c0_g2_i1:50-502(-)